MSSSNVLGAGRYRSLQRYFTTSSLSTAPPGGISCSLLATHHRPFGRLFRRTERCCPSMMPPRYGAAYWWHGISRHCPPASVIPGRRGFLKWRRPALFKWSGANPWAERTAGTPRRPGYQPTGVTPTYPASGRT